MALILDKVKPKKEDQAINIDSLLINKPKNRVRLIGVEIEGGWNKNPEGMEPIRDGSVFKDMGDDGRLGRAELPGYKCGELPIGPWQPAQISAAMKKAWPQAVDKSCGLHVHMSFGDKNLFRYMLLADSPAYQETILEYLARWAKEEGFSPKDPIWDRLNGKSIYCQKKFWPQAQMIKNQKDHDQQRFGHRYTAVNYCYERFSTVEVRVLPMTGSVEQGIRGVRRVIDITNAYLVKAEKSKVKEFGKVDLDKAGSTIKLELKKGVVYEEYYED